MHTLPIVLMLVSLTSVDATPTPIAPFQTLDDLVGGKWRWIG